MTFLTKTCPPTEVCATNIYGNSLLKYTEGGDKTSQYSYLVELVTGSPTTGSTNFRAARAHTHTHELPRDFRTVRGARTWATANPSGQEKPAEKHSQKFKVMKFEDFERKCVVDFLLQNFLTNFPRKKRPKFCYRNFTTFFAQKFTRSKTIVTSCSLWGQTHARKTVITKDVFLLEESLESLKVSKFSRKWWVSAVFVTLGTRKKTEFAAPRVNAPAQSVP